MNVTARVCYIMNRYPSVSHTFIQREISAVRDAGVEVLPVALVRAPDGETLSDADRRARAETATIRPVSPLVLWRAVVAPAVRHPGAFFATLAQAIRTARTDVRDALWGLFYFVEAMILWEHCERNSVRHVHAHFASAPSDLAWFASSFGNRARRAGDPPWSWSMTVHGWHEFVAERHHSLGEKVAAADFVVCISDYTRSQLMRQVDAVHWAKLHVRHCGIDPAMFRPADADPNPPDATPADTVLCVGRLDAEKGHLVLVDALRLLRDRGVEATAVLVGTGPWQPVIEERVRELELTDDVRLTGAIGQDEIADYYRRATLFCLPTFIEGLPVVLMEAMASGLPVVTTPVNGIPELVETGVTGVLVAPGRPDLLADALARVLRDPAFRAELARAGRERVLAEFDITRIGPAIAALLASAPGARVSSAPAP